MKKEPVILVTNDDSLLAPGLALLVEEAQKWGKVIVVAPQNAQSGMGHAVTVNTHIRLTQNNMFPGVETYSCTGTPVDCVKIGINKVLNNRVPDLIVSGVNHGTNIATNILYSGTMSAAVEGALENIPSIGFSHENHGWDVDLDICRPIISATIKNVLENGLGANTCLSVNIPHVKEGEIKGVKICRQAQAYWEDTFDERLDPLGKPYYWLTGDFVNHDEGTDADFNALKAGYATVVPVQFDMTAYKEIKKLQEWNWNE